MARLRYGELVAENARLRRIIARQDEQLQAQARRIHSLELLVAKLQEQLEIVQRQQKRQAAPFAKEPPQSDPQPPGRRPGAPYGTKAHRRAPQPAEITESYEVPLPATCSHCGHGRIEASGQAQQYQVELPRQAIYRRFDITIGRCQQCRGRVQGRHALQTSDALGAARSQLGPVLQAFLAILQKRLGLAYGKCVRLLESVWGIRLSRGGVVQALARLARRVRPAVERIGHGIRAAPAVSVDETGWRIGGHSAWLHTQVTDRAVHYAIATTRSAEVTAQVLGWDYAGVLIHDGFRSYDNFRRAQHQQCLAHLLRRCHEILAVGVPKQSAAMVRWLQAHLRAALAYREQLRQQPRWKKTVRLWVWHQERELRDRLLRWQPRREELLRLRHFVLRYAGSLFTFLRYRTEATSWRAEQALRPAVVNRKVWGGNRTLAGAQVQSTLMTIIGTLERQTRSVIDTLAKTGHTGSLRLRLAA